MLLASHAWALVGLTAVALWYFVYLGLNPEKVFRYDIKPHRVKVGILSVVAWIPTTAIFMHLRLFGIATPLVLLGFFCLTGWRIYTSDVTWRKRRQRRLAAEQDRKERQEAAYWRRPRAT